MAVLLKAIENIIILTLSLIPKYFIPAVKSHTTTKDKYLITICPIVVFLLTFIRYLLMEHSAKFINQSGSMSGQTLRNMIWQKLEKANIVFLKEIDESVVTKLIMFNLTEILTFIGNVPDLFSFPLIFIFFMGFLTANIGITTFSLIFVFLVTYLILLFLVRKINQEEISTQFTTSQRTLLVLEILSKFRNVKSNNFEDYFQKKIEEVRRLETGHLASNDRYKSFASFFIDLSGIFSVLIIIYLQSLLGNRLSVEETFAIVSLVMSLKNPLHKFRGIMVMYY